MSPTATKPISAATPSNVTTRRLTTLWAKGTGIAILAVAIAFALADVLTGPIFVNGSTEVTLTNVMVFTVIGSTTGAIIAFATARLARRPRRAFHTVTLIALAGYAVVPFTATESLEAALWLNIFHVVVAIPVLWTLTGYLPKDRASAQA